VVVAFKATLFGMNDEHPNILRVHVRLQQTRGSAASDTRHLLSAVLAYVSLHHFSAARVICAHLLPQGLGSAAVYRMLRQGLSQQLHQLEDSSWLPTAVLLIIGLRLRSFVESVPFCRESTLAQALEHFCLSIRCDAMRLRAITMDKLLTYYRS
jgi:hypothetical protein